MLKSDLAALPIFLQVAETGSFTDAARRLGISKALVSLRVSELETQLGARLFDRNTRRTRLTEAGMTLFKGARQAVEAIESVEATLELGQSAPRGPLRVTSTVELGSHLAFAVAPSFSKVCPEVNLEIFATNETLDFAEHNLHLAIRPGPPRDSDMIRLKLGVARWRLFASPAYLKRRGRPKRPEDLVDHDGLLFTPSGRSRPVVEWELRSGARRAEGRPRKVMQATSLPALRCAAVAGMGITLLLDRAFEEDIASRSLVPVLEPWDAGEVEIAAYYREGQGNLPKLRAFLDHLKATRAFAT